MQKTLEVLAKEHSTDNANKERFLKASVEVLKGSNSELARAVRPYFYDEKGQFIGNEQSTKALFDALGPKYESLEKYLHPGWNQYNPLNPAGVATGLRTLANASYGASMASFWMGNPLAAATSLGGAAASQLADVVEGARHNAAMRDLEGHKYNSGLLGFLERAWYSFTDTVKAIPESLFNWRTVLRGAAGVAPDLAGVIGLGDYFASYNRHQKRAVSAAAEKAFVDFIKVAGDYKPRSEHELRLIKPPAEYYQPMEQLQNGPRIVPATAGVAEVANLGYDVAKERAKLNYVEPRAAA